MAEIEGPGTSGERGLSRRELMKRGAIAGGAVLWAAPVIQSLATPAMAQVRSRCGCCYCFDGDRNNPTDDQCLENGDTGPKASPEACAAFCASEGFTGSQQCHEFAGGCTCRQITDPGVDPGENGCFCA